MVDSLQSSSYGIPLLTAGVEGLAKENMVWLGLPYPHKIPTFSNSSSELLTNSALGECKKHFLETGEDLALKLYKMIYNYLELILFKGSTLQVEM